MVRIIVGHILGALAFAGASFVWLHFTSTVYPYTMRQPSSFRHGVFLNLSNRHVETFSPALGSPNTGVTVVAVPGSSTPDPLQYLRNQGARSAKKDGTLTIDGHHRRLTMARFSSGGVKWVVEQASFVDHGLLWRLTVSYEPRYSSLRPVMIKMLTSFKAVSGAKRGKR